jgi:hypothetical protein
MPWNSNLLEPRRSRSSGVASAKRGWLWVLWNKVNSSIYGQDSFIAFESVRKKETCYERKTYTTILQST